MRMFGKPDVIGYSNGKIDVREIERDKANKIIIKNHYSHKIYKQCWGQNTCKRIRKGQLSTNLGNSDTSNSLIKLGRNVAS